MGMSDSLKMFNLGGKINTSKIPKLKAFFGFRGQSVVYPSLSSSLHTDKATATSVSLTEVKPH